MLAVVSIEGNDLDEGVAPRCATTLAAFARQHELAIVYGDPEPGEAPQRLGARSFLAALRTALPGYQIIALLVDAIYPGDDSIEVDLLRSSLEDGVIPVSITTAHNAALSAAALQRRLRADMVFLLTPQGTLREVRTLTVAEAADRSAPLIITGQGPGDVRPFHVDAAAGEVA